MLSVNSYFEQIFLGSFGIVAQLLIIHQVAQIFCMLYLLCKLGPLGASAALRLLRAGNTFYSISSIIEVGAIFQEEKIFLIKIHFVLANFDTKNYFNFGKRAKRYSLSILSKS